MQWLLKLSNINKYLNLMINAKASDMFLTFGEYPTLRINTKILKYNKMEVINDNMLDVIANDLAWISNKINFKTSIDLSLSYEDRYFRINISKQKWHMMIVVRLLLSEIPDLNWNWSSEVFKKIIWKPNWIIVVSWPAWSWKTTLLASMIENINKEEAKHIISIEDPIEYVFTSKKSIIEQKELDKDIWSFSEALKASMRQNPDVIVFWEMRDKDSIKNAITLAETWHLVITTTHARSAWQTISKIIDSFDSEHQNQIRSQLADSLVAVINQRMLKKKDTDGIVIAQEIMLNNTAIANNIRKNDIKNINNTILTSRKEWMQLLDHHLVLLVQNWVIDKNTAIINANSISYINDNLT